MTREFLSVLVLAALPALGNLGGGILVEMIRVSPKGLGLALHAAAGVVLAVVGVELLPQALAAEPAWAVVLAFFAGGALFIALDEAMGLVRSRFAADVDTGNGPWLIYAGVAVDLFSDGVLIGAGSTISLGLALLLALGQVIADIPDGFAAMASFRRQNVSRQRRILLSVSFALPVLLGATIGYWLMRGQGEFVKLITLALTAGVLSTVTVEEIVPEAHRNGEARLAALVFVGGFALFALLSVYLN